MHLLLLLYPRPFRRRFGAEWLEMADWHRRALSGASFARTRLMATLSLDTVRNLPMAYLDMMKRRGGAPPERGSWGRDARYAVMALARNRVFTVTAVASVAFGIAVNTATFSVVNGVLLRPLPYEEPDRLAVVWNEFPGSGMARLPMSGPQVEMLRQEPDLFEDVAGVWATSGTVVDREGGLTQIALGVATPNFFALFGVQPSLGRSWVRDAAEGPAPSGVVISHELWQGRYGADPAILERALDLNGQPVQVVGVLPAGFTLFFPEDGAVPPRFDAYTALPWDLSVLPPAQHYLRVVGRLRASTDWPRAKQGVASAANRARMTYPELQSTGDQFTVHPLQEDTVRAARPVLIALLGAVGLFLLLASTNVASLILARTLGRSRELAIRTSLGATRTSLARLVVVESLIVTLLGAGGGVWLGRLGATALWALRPGGLSRADALPLDARVLSFSVGLSLLAGLVFALVSLLAVRVTRPSLGLKGAGGSAGGMGRRLRELLTAAEVAVGLVLVVGSALMVQSLNSLGRESIGFDPGSALTFRVPLSLRRFSTDQERDQVAREIERRVSALPGVTEVGATSHLPFNDWANWAEAAAPEGTPDADRAAYFADLRAVTPGYLQAIGAELVAGRWLGDGDGVDGAPVVILDETMAARAFPGGDAVGKVLEPSRFSGGQFVITKAMVVGVVRDIRDRSPSRPSGGQVFWPFGQSPRWELTYFVRTAGDPAALAEAVQREVRAVSPDLAPARLAPMADYVEVATGLTRFVALVGSIFSALAVLLAMIGLYGVVAFVTIQRTQEIAVRMVVGASRTEVLRGIVGQGLKVGVIGVVWGLAASLWFTRYMRGLVYGVSPHDPVTLALAGLLLLAVAAGASLLPALRAVTVDPVTALRES
jgi:predicted permease